MHCVNNIQNFLLPKERNNFIDLTKNSCHFCGVRLLLSAEKKSKDSCIWLSSFHHRGACSRWQNSPLPTNYCGVENAATLQHAKNYGNENS